MRDFSANIALKLEKQLSEQQQLSPTKGLKKLPTINVDGESIKIEETNEVLQDDSDQFLTDYCSICCTNEIAIGGEPLTEKEKENTFEFSCKHRFC